MGSRWLASGGLLATGVLVASCHSASNAPGAAGSSNGGGGGGPSPSCAAPALHKGQGTYYAATGGGACGFDPTPNDLMVAAMNQPDYDNSGVCGACVAVTGPNGSATVRIVDLCPECKSGDLDLSQSAFAKLADPSLGRIAIQWRFVACSVSGPIRYHFKDGSSQWWTAVQIRNHRYAIAKFEYMKAGAYVNVPRVNYNYFVAGSGMGPGPYAFRVSDVQGHVLVDHGIALQPNSDVPGAAQFPSCP